MSNIHHLNAIRVLREIVRKLGTDERVNKPSIEITGDSRPTVTWHLNSEHPDEAHGAIIDHIAEVLDVTFTPNEQFHWTCVVQDIDGVTVEFVVFSDTINPKRGRKLKAVNA
jgi:hypothetical protein